MAHTDEIISVKASEDLSTAHFRAVRGTANGVLLATSGRRPLGILQQGAASGDSTTVILSGHTRAVAQGAIAAGDDLTPGTAGAIRKAIQGEDGFAIALESAADGDWFEVLVSPSSSAKLGLSRKGYDPDSGRANSSLSFDAATRVLTVGASDAYTFVSEGVEHTKDGDETITISDVEGNHFVYFDATGELQDQGAFSEALILSRAYTAQILWDATNKYPLAIGDERHTWALEGHDHLARHRTLRSMLDRSNPANVCALTPGAGAPGGNGSQNSHAQIALGDGGIYDEDIRLLTTETAQVLAPIAQVPIYYFDGVLVRVKLADDYPLIQTGALGPASPGPTQTIFTGANGRIAYNPIAGGLGSLVEVSQNDFCLTHVFLTNDIRFRVAGFVGQSVYLTQGAARDGVQTELRSIQLLGLPSQEWVWLYSLIFQSNSAWANAPKAALFATDTGEAAFDWRNLTPRIA